jgi:hypothetical protein
MRVASAIGAALLLIACGEDDSPAGGTYLVTVTVDGPGRVLSLPPAIDCPGTCVASFAAGAWVTLAATSPDEARFVEWSRGCAGAIGCGFTVAADADVVARFEPMPARQKK